VGVGTDGSVGRQVDYSFTSADLHRPVREVLAEKGYATGWFATLPADAKGALVVAGIAGVGAVVTVVSLGVRALLG
jgi:hypothetical protein